MARDHRKLRAFALADDLVLRVYRATSSYPVSERFGLQAQIRRAAVSLPTNVVEGCARDSEGDYMRFLDIAIGSCRELSYLIDLSARLGFMRADDAAPLADQADHVAAMLLNLRHALEE
jgi:four helix bundle protein